MAVVIAPQKHSDTLPKRLAKPHPKTRPITATLDHPLILDIKLLKRLDMTTFTKKGLIALSKFCGISLIKTDTRKRLGKCVRTIRGSRRPGEGAGGAEGPLGEAGGRRGKRPPRGRGRVRFKMAGEEGSPDEDSSDVVCGGRGEGGRGLRGVRSCRGGEGERRRLIESIVKGSVETVIPEPCKTCSRSEQPERFHSHPRMGTRGGEMPGEGKLEERFRRSVTTKGGSSSQESLAVSEGRGGEKSPTKSGSSGELLSPGGGSKGKGKGASSTRTKREGRKTTGKAGEGQKEEKTPTEEEAMRFVTGCYVCGKQLSPKSRMKHEKSCIVEWRAQNVQVPAEKRRPEPKRPDFRFTGDLDCEGSFESIWANHMDSLVPCKKCGRRFFPDRIERHENCCNNAPVSFKHKH